mgnify:CR=1 FL=1
MLTMTIPSVCRCLLLVWALPLAAWAQASGESAETGPAETASPQGAAPSRLRQAVEARLRQPDAVEPPTDRRLTAAQRQELREQVRRAWDGRGAAQSTPERPSAPR